MENCSVEDKYFKNGVEAAMRTLQEVIFAINRVIYNENMTRESTLRFFNELTFSLNTQYLPNNLQKSRLFHNVQLETPQTKPTTNASTNTEQKIVHATTKDMSDNSDFLGFGTAGKTQQASRQKIVHTMTEDMLDDSDFLDLTTAGKTQQASKQKIVHTMPEDMLDDSDFLDLTTAGKTQQPLVNSTFKKPVLIKSIRKPNNNYNIAASGDIILPTSNQESIESKKHFNGNSSRRLANGIPKKIEQTTEKVSSPLSKCKKRYPDAKPAEEFQSDGLSTDTSTTSLKRKIVKDRSSPLKKSGRIRKRKESSKIIPLKDVIQDIKQYNIEDEMSSESAEVIMTKSMQTPQNDVFKQITVGNKIEDKTQNNMDDEKSGESPKFETEIDKNTSKDKPEKDAGKKKNQKTSIVRPKSQRRAKPKQTLDKIPEIMQNKMDDGMSSEPAEVIMNNSKQEPQNDLSTKFSDSNLTEAKSRNDMNDETSYEVPESKKDIDTDTSQVNSEKGAKKKRKRYSAWKPERFTKPRPSKTSLEKKKSIPTREKANNSTEKIVDGKIPKTPHSLDEIWKDYLAYIGKSPLRNTSTGRRNLFDLESFSEELSHYCDK